MADKRCESETNAFGICPRCGRGFDSDLYDVERCVKCGEEFSTECCLGSGDPATYEYHCISCDSEV